MRSPRLSGSQRRVRSAGLDARPASSAAQSAGRAVWPPSPTETYPRDCKQGAPRWATSSVLSTLSVLLILTAALCAAPTPAVARAPEPAELVAAEPGLVLYRCRSRSAEDLQPLAQQILGSRGKAVVDRAGNALLLSGPEELVAEATNLLSTLDRPRRSVIVRFESVDSEELAADGFDVRWRVRSGGVLVGDVFRRTTGVQVQIDVLSQARKGRSRTQGQLRILDGETGRISTGQTQNVRSRTSRRGPFGRVVTESIETLSAETGFEAEPRVLSDKEVELRLRPFQGRIENDGSITNREAETSVVVAPGETVVVGQFERNSRSSSSSGPVGSTQVRSSDQQLLLVTVELP